MYFKKLFILFTVAEVILYFVNGHQSKKSLTFVIDRTSSMGTVINHVKSTTNKIFDSVFKANSSLIDEFILVTFDDPNVQEPIVTKDKTVFKNALANITLVNGRSCPEYSMSGIETALKISKPNSNLYVFTDASANDFHKSEQVINLSQKKTIQVNFLLTGICKKFIGKYYTVYEDIAEVTSGQIFHIKKDDVTKIIDYIIETVKYKRTILLTKNLRIPDETIRFRIDSKIHNVMISMSSKSPSYEVIDSDGRTIDVNEIVHTQKVYVDNIDVGPGTYTIKHRSEDLGSIVITGSTSICFEYGFSFKKPTSLKETSTKPIEADADRQYLAIEVDNVDRDVELATAELIDIDYYPFKNLTLKLVNAEKQFYVSESFVPPKNMFKIAINGYTKSKEKITRVSSSTIEYQKIELEKADKTSPVVNILSETPINVEFGAPLTLNCKVHGYPEPLITWMDALGNILPSEPTQIIDYPYVYISQLEIKKVVENSTIACKAVNEVGNNKASIEIMTKKETYFIVIEKPKDSITVEYGTNGELKCIINATSPATISWYKDSVQLSNNTNYMITPDGSKLTIINMQSKLAGHYNVRAFNSDDSMNFLFNVSTFVEVPYIDKSNTSYKKKQKESIKILCSVTRGKPKPIISWSFSKDGSNFLEPMKSSKAFFYIDDVKKDHSGFYRCKAHNEFGEDFHDIELIVEYSPSIMINKTKQKFIEGENVRLYYSVDGSPKPKVQWFFNNVKINSSSKYTILDNSLSFTASKSDDGNFTCVAENHIKPADSKSIRLFVYVPVAIESPEPSEFNLNVGSTQTLPCHVSGYPPPRIKWMFIPKMNNVLNIMITHGSDNSITLDRVQIYHEGQYTCTASIGSNSQSITYNINVLERPTIKPLANRDFVAMVGDEFLFIKCEVSGSPKPTVTWKLNGYNLALVGDYAVDSSNSLWIKNLTLDHKGTYTCEARNIEGYTKVEYELTVKEFIVPELQLHQKINAVSPTEVKCGKKKFKTDKIRWYKGNKLLKVGRLFLSDISEAGTYSCRLNSLTSSLSRSYEVVVDIGYEPSFVADVETNIEYKENSIGILNCSARGEPTPKVKWDRDFSIRSEKSMVYKFKMTKDDLGIRYRCIVSNTYGKKIRSFLIKNEACLLHTDENAGLNMPMFLSKESRWILEKAIPIYKDIDIFCPGSFLTYNGKRLGINEHVSAICKDKTIFQINGEMYDISKMQCNETIKPAHTKSELACGHGNTKIVNVGYELNSEFLNIFEVCIDIDQYKVHFAKHLIHPNIANMELKNCKFIDIYDYLPLNFEDIYDCEKQSISTISTSSSTARKCCYGRRHLVNPMDVLPGLQQIATYSYLNIVPIWNSCGTENWDEVEHRIRDLSIKNNILLDVFTGISHSVKHPVKNSDYQLQDRHNLQQRVPLYIWKVVQKHFERPKHESRYKKTKIKETPPSIAIILINIPNLTYKEASKYVICKDVCYETEWMRSEQWYDVTRGYIFCCTVNEFEIAFEYTNLFKAKGKLLIN